MNTISSRFIWIFCSKLNESHRIVHRFSCERCLWKKLDKHVSSICARSSNNFCTFRVYVQLIVFNRCVIRWNSSKSNTNHDDRVCWLVIHTYKHTNTRTIHSYICVYRDWANKWVKNMYVAFQMKSTSHTHLFSSH